MVKHAGGINKIKHVQVNFMIPKPFSRVVLAIGEPIHPDKSTTMDELQAARDFAENSINSLSSEAQKIFD